MKRIKKIVVLLIFSIIIFMCGCTYATDTFQLEFKIINNKENERVDLYILLPKEYIEFAISQSYVNIDYDGASTLKENTIPGIKVNKEKVQDEVYKENGVEYVQVLLQKEDGKYKFDILENYQKMDIKFRLKNEQKDYIVHIDNFEIQDGKCKIEYDYEKDEVKQPDKIIVPTSAIILIILLILVIVIGGMAYIKQKREVGE